jgi:hypothetical protein
MMMKIAVKIKIYKIQIKKILYWLILVIALLKINYICFGHKNGVLKIKFNINY